MTHETVIEDRPIQLVGAAGAKLGEAEWAPEEGARARVLVEDESAVEADRRGYLELPRPELGDPREPDQDILARCVLLDVRPDVRIKRFLTKDEPLAIVNGGGRIEREYGLGRGALDLMVFWNEARHAIEVQIRRDTETEEDALDQIAGYLDRAGLGEGWLVMFDLRKELSWQEKLFVREIEHAGKRVRIVGC